MSRLRRLAGRAREAWRRERLLRRTAHALLPPAPEAFAAYGKGVLLIPPARVENPECISLGPGVIVHEHAWLCVQRRPGLPAPALSIGDRTSFNRFAKVVCHGSVHFGADVILADRVYVSDVEHEPVPGGDVRLTEPRPVVIGAGVFLGVGVVVKPGVTVGEGAYVAAAAVVHDDVPPYSVVTGDPARVVRRRDPATERWERVSDRP